MEEIETNSVKITIVIPVYNMEKLIGNCLENILQQTLKEIEIICIDDGSTDKTLNILKKYVVKNSRIKVISTPNRGSGTRERF